MVETTFGDVQSRFIRTKHNEILRPLAVLERGSIIDDGSRERHPFLDLPSSGNTLTLTLILTLILGIPRLTWLRRHPPSSVNSPNPNPNPNPNPGPQETTTVIYQLTKQVYDKYKAISIRNAKSMTSTVSTGLKRRL